MYGLPELHRDELAALSRAPVAIVGAPGCYPTTTLLALAPLARAGLIADLVVDAKSGVSGAGREPKAGHRCIGEVNESVRRTASAAIATSPRSSRSSRSRAWRQGWPRTPTRGPAGVDFVPHLVPMTRGILSTCHVRTTRPDRPRPSSTRSTRPPTAREPFVTVVDAAPATKHVLGSNHAQVHVRHDPRSGRVIAIGVIDNLVKGAAGQAIQAFNLVHGLPETAGLGQLPLAPLR